MAKLKVYGGLTLNDECKQVRTIVATTSMNKAAELVGCSISEIRSYWTTTHNELELAVALNQPGVALQASSSMGKDFSPMDSDRSEPKRIKVERTCPRCHTRAYHWGNDHGIKHRIACARCSHEWMGRIKKEEME